MAATLRFLPPAVAADKSGPGFSGYVEASGISCWETTDVFILTGVSDEEVTLSK